MAHARDRIVPSISGAAGGDLRSAGGRSPPGVLSRGSGYAERRRTRLTELEPLSQRAEDVDQVVDLFIRVGGRDLDPEANLVLRHQRVGRHRGVDPFVEQVAADLVDLVVIGQRAPR